MLSHEIRNNWTTEARNNSTLIRSLVKRGYRCMTITFDDGWRGVAIPFSSQEEINEDFANVWLRTKTITGPEGNQERLLTLLSTSADSPFATLCSNFVDPGEDGEARKAILESPVAWWARWKGLLGNRSSDCRVYDVLAELAALTYLHKLGQNPKWRGPDRSSCDIDCGSTVYEVKSTTSRRQTSFTAHGFFQLAEAGVSKQLLFFRFERSDGGLTIDGLVESLVNGGFSERLLEDALDNLGYPKGRSSRSEAFNLLEARVYEVDDSFPRIEASSFVEGALPAGISSLQYSVSLENVPYTTVTDEVREAANGERKG